MSPSPTPATRFLASHDVPFRLHEYEVVTEEPTYGEAVTASLGVSPARLFKTLVAQVDGKPQVARAPVERRLDPKVLARAAGGKRARLSTPASARQLTGYEVGGISPFGQRRRLPAFADATLEGHPTVFVSAGRCGLQVELRPADPVSLLRPRLTQGLGV